MGWRLFVLGAVGLLVGALVLISPIDQGHVSVVSLGSGTWLDVSVPRASSWTGAGVDVRLSWGSIPPPSPCGGYGPMCPSKVGTLESYLQVFDCGTAPCTGTGNYTFLGSTDAAPGGSSGFPAALGHHYQVWVWASQNTTPVPSIPVRYALETPPLGGAAGVALIVGGGSAMVVAVLEWRRRRRAPAADSFS